MAEFASNAKANTALTLGGIGLGLGVLDGGLGMLTGRNGFVNNGWNGYVTKDEAGMMNELAKKESEIALLKADQASEIKMTEVYRQAHDEIVKVRDAFQFFKEQQMVVNAQVASNVAINANNIASLKTALEGITKTVVPIDVVCPEPMPAKNSWTAPTA